MPDLPTLGDAALALLIAGALFLLRFLLIVRRLRRLSGATVVSFRQHARHARQAAAFGPDLEPERRYAMRQFYAGTALAGAGLAAAAWMLVASVLGPFVSRAAGH